MSGLKDAGGLIVAAVCIAHCLAAPFLLTAAGYAIAAPGPGAVADTPAPDETCCPRCRGEQTEPPSPPAASRPDSLSGDCYRTPAVCRVLAVVAVVVGLAAFIPGFRRHHRWPVPAVGVIGLTLLTASGVFSHHLPAPGWERPVMVTGSGLLILAHLLNLRWGRCCPACPAPIPLPPTAGK